jgi:hypothetical protein
MGKPTRIPLSVKAVAVLYMLVGALVVMNTVWRLANGESTILKFAA